MKYEVFASKHNAQVGQRPVRGGEAIMTCRKLKSVVIILIATLSCTIHICAQPQSAKPSYNFTRALEEAQKGNKSEAMDFLTKEIALEDYDMAIMLNPDYAYSYLGKG